MALSGDHGAVLVSLEIVTHLPSESALMIPIQRGMRPPEGALAWLNLEAGIYFQVLYRIRERGAKALPEEEHLYEKTTEVVSIHLSPPFHRILIEMDRASNCCSVDVKGLTGPVAHHPRASVVDGGGYRITARRMQESVPTLLIQMGYYRWPVAASTNSHYLVTRGRRSYGSCRSEAIHQVVEKAYDLLGWPKPPAPAESRLVGTPTVPLDESISRCLNFLCDRADCWSTKMDTYESVCKALRVHAEWLAMLEALAFGLRRWLVYRIKVKQIINCELVKFDDKDIHQYQGPGIPACTLLRAAVEGWMQLCKEAVETLGGLADSDSIELGACIEKYLDPDANDITIVTIDAVGSLKPVGYKTWSDVLPDNIRLKPNFARQYWPMKFMDRSVEQVVIDLFMRHQLDSLPPGTSRSLKTLNGSMATLSKAIEAVIASLRLNMPMKLKGNKNAR